MDKISSDATWLENETNRLSSIIKKHTDGTSLLAAKKLDEIKRKSNILSTFKKRTFADRNQAARENQKNKGADGKSHPGDGEERIVRQEL